MNLKQFLAESERAHVALPRALGYAREDVDEMPMVVVTPSGERFAVVGVSVEPVDDSGRVVIAVAGRRELGLEE